MQRRSKLRHLHSKIFDHKFTPLLQRMLRRQGLALLSAIVAIGASSPALAGSGPQTKLVRCGEESCLQVSGYRDDSASIVSLNGEAVSVEGEENWRIRLSLDTVREISSPNARTIEVSLLNPLTERETLADADLPIGLLGDISQLAFIEVRAP